MDNEDFIVSILTLEKDRVITPETLKKIRRWCKKKGWELGTYSKLTYLLKRVLEEHDKGFQKDIYPKEAYERLEELEGVVALGDDDSIKEDYPGILELLPANFQRKKITKILLTKTRVLRK